MVFPLVLDQLTPDADREQAWRRLIEALGEAGLLDGVGPLADAIARQVFVLDAYRGVRREEVLAGWRSNMTATMSHVQERRAPGPQDDDSALRLVGAARAEQGVSVSEVVRTAAIQQRVFIEMAQTLAPPSRHRENLLLELMNWQQTWSAWGINALVIGHREAELALHRRANERRAVFVQRLLTSRLPGSEILEHSEEYGLDPTALYVALRSRPSSVAELRSLERSLQLFPSSRQSRGMVAMIEGDLYGFARVVDDLHPTFAVGVSPPATLQDLHQVFRLATRALDSALALGRTGVTSLDDLGLRAAVVADHEVTDVLLQRYVQPFLAQGEVGEAILETVETYLGNQSSPGQTAKDLYVHTNTVRYRLSRFEAVTGCSLHEAHSLVEVWWALEARRLLRVAGAPGS